MSLTAAEPSNVSADSSAGPNCLTDACRATRSAVGSSTSGADRASARTTAETDHLVRHRAREGGIASRRHQLGKVLAAGGIADRVVVKCSRRNVKLAGDI